METSLSDFKNLKNLKAAFSFWTDGSYTEILNLELILRDSVVEKTQKVYGIDSFCKYFSTLKFIPEYIHQLASLKEEGKSVFNESFLNYLQRLRFSFDIKAVSEAEAVLRGQTVLAISGPKIELKIVENALFAIIRAESETNFELKTSQKPYKEIAIKEICQSGNLL
jgi:nicotinic acid phosphoribosyltransferase